MMCFYSNLWPFSRFGKFHVFLENSSHQYFSIKKFSNKQIKYSFPLLPFLLFDSCCCNILNINEKFPASFRFSFSSVFSISCLISCFSSIRKKFFENFSNTTTKTILFVIKNRKQARKNRPNQDRKKILDCPKFD